MTEGARRVLVWNQYAEPDTAATSLLLRELVSRFDAAAVYVHVIHGNPSYRPTESVSWRPWQLWRRKSDETIVRSTRFDRENMRGRIANYLSFVSLSTLFAMFTRCDAIVVMSDPPILVLAAVFVGKLRRKPVVYWLQDYHPDFLVGIGRLRNTRTVRLWSRLHVASMRRCALVIAIGRDMAARLEAAGVPLRAFALCRTGHPSTGPLERHRHRPRRSVRDWLLFTAVK